jgi:predicted esterase
VRVDRDVQVHLVETPVHGRVLVRPASGAVGILVGFHGYAENAAIQLDRLTAIPGTDEWVLASIQGLNRFYRGRSQDTVASWMTREDRYHAISANVAYVDRAITRVRKECGGTDENGAPLFLAGFSQGVAMAFRAAVHGLNKADGVIAVGGDVPPELLRIPDARFPPVLLIRGARDDWYTQPKLDADVAALQERGVAVSALVVDAGHEWSPEVSAAAARFLTS